ncbi:MAG: diguanylate cyclase [Myxococcota bacterium]
MMEAAALPENVPTVLVVDDSPSMRTMLREMLEQKGGARVLEASDGTVALKLVVSEQIDCVLCDVNMPTMDGYSFLRAVRSRHSRLELPVLLLTSQDAVSDRVQGFKLGASDFLSKPVALEELLARTETNISLARMYRQMQRMVMTDPLTGVANRRRFDEALQAELARARRTQQQLSLLLVDVDKFKSINDWYGHPKGDAVLVSLAQTLTSEMRSYDILARVGGEEFAVVLPGEPLAGAVAMAERIRAKVEANSLGGLPEANVTISVGVTSGPRGDDDDPQQLYARADARLYEAKRTGRNRVCVDEPPAGEAGGPR